MLKIAITNTAMEEGTPHSSEAKVHREPRCSHVHRKMRGTNVAVHVKLRRASQNYC